MATYFQSINEGGSVIIDDNAGRMILKNKGRLCDIFSFTDSYTNNGVSIGKLAYGLNTGDRFIALEPIRNSSVGYGQLFYAGNNTIYIATKSPSSISLDYIASNTNAYVFGEMNKGDIYSGMQCFNEYGQKVYQSDAQLANMTGMITLPAGTGDSWGDGYLGENELLVPLSCGSHVKPNFDVSSAKWYGYVHHYLWSVSGTRAYMNDFYMGFFNQSVFPDFIGRFPPSNNMYLDSKYLINYWQSLKVSKTYLSD